MMVNPPMTNCALSRDAREPRFQVSFQESMTCQNARGNIFFSIWLVAFKHIYSYMKLDISLRMKQTDLLNFILSESACKA